MRSRILVCAYACAADPSTTFAGGGDLLGWEMVGRLSRTYPLWVLTASQNQGAIEEALKKGPLQGVQFVYIDLPDWLHPLLRLQGGLQLYAYLWQWKAYFVARKLHKEVHFTAFHHLTYENDWMASIIGALLPIPFVRGPAGGAHRVPRKFRRRFPAASRLWEYARMGLQWVLRHDPFFAIGNERARVLLMANREALDALPARWRQKAQLLSVNGVSLSSIPYEVPPFGAETRPLQLPKHGHFQLLTAGRLVPLKGFDLAIRAFALFLSRLKHDGRGDRAEFTIVGEGPERSRLQELTRELRLEDRVRLTDWMTREALFREMALCDVFIFPSLRDGGGLVVVEAMASGKPVVCLDLGGPAMHVADGCGVKVSPHFPEQAVTDLASALERLYSDEQLRLAMGKAARRRAQEVYDWDRVAERILGVYREALGISPELRMQSARSQESEARSESVGL